MRLVLLGPPGAGKGTQAATIAATFAIPHISTGDIFRANVKEGTPLGQEAQGYMNRGDLVPDDVVNRMVADRLTHEDCANGFLLDGYPRTVAQGRVLEAALGERGEPLHAVLHFTVPDEELERRIARRRELEQRSDDGDEVFHRRLREYALVTAELVPWYRERGVLVDIDAVGTIDEVAERALAACRGALDDGGSAEGAA